MANTKFAPDEAMTVTTGDKFVGEIWLQETREYLKMNLVAAPLCKNIEFEGKKGDVVHIPDVTALTVNNKVATDAVVISSPTETEFTLTVNKHKHVAWLLEDILEVQSMYDLRNEYTKGAGYELAKAIDTDLLAGFYGDFGQSITGGALVTDANLQKAIELMDLGDVPGTDRSFIFRPTQKSTFFNLDKFYRADFRGGGGSILSSGTGPGGDLRGGMGPSDNKDSKFGEIYGCGVYFSRNVPLSTTYKNIAIQKDAYALAIQKSPRFQAQYKEEYLGWLFVVDVIYGYAEFRDGCGIVITTTA